MADWIAAVPSAPYWLGILAQLPVLALFTASCQWQWTALGVWSFGHALPFGVGAVVAARCAGAGDWSWLLALAAGSFAAALLARMLAPVLARRTGVAFAMLTMGAAELAHQSAQSFASVAGGDAGIAFDWPASGPWARLAVVWAAFAAGMLALHAMNRTELLAAARLVRADADRAGLLGLDVVRVRSAVLARAWAVAGAAGAMAAIAFEHVSPAVFAPDRSTLVLIASITGLQCVTGGGTSSAHARHHVARRLRSRLHPAMASLAGAAICLAFGPVLAGWTRHSELMLGLVFLLVVVMRARFGDHRG